MNVAGRSPVPPPDAVDVGGVDEFAEAVPKVVRMAGREVAVVRWKGEFFALRNVCPHQSQSFARGLVANDTTVSEMGEYRTGEPVLICPWHTWPYGLRTGQCTVDPTKRVRAFDVYVHNDRVLVDARSRNRSTNPRGPEGDH